MSQHEPADDDFLRSLAARMHAVTDRLEPLVAIAAARPEAPRVRIVGRAAAVGLVAAAAVGVIVVTASRPSVNEATPNSAPIVVETTFPGSLPPRETLPLVDPEARNILVVGTDNGSCNDAPDLEPGLGDRVGFGERTDTIIVLRVEPQNGTAAMLSLPRDLWVPIPGRGSARINAAFVADDPQSLIDTIALNFGIPIDHYVQIDFCAFKRIVDAVGGIAVPFAAPVRDSHTGFQSAAGCVELDGDAALAYVRARHLEFQDAAGVWQRDPTSDVGRIARQQDFVRRAIAAVRDRGMTDVGLGRALLDSVQQDLVVDSGLTMARMLEYLRLVDGLDPASLAGYRIEGTPTVIAGNTVLTPVLDTPSMVSVLARFSGNDADVPTTAVMPDPTADALTEAMVVPPSDQSC